MQTWVFKVLAGETLQTWGDFTNWWRKEQGKGSGKEQQGNIQKEVWKDQLLVWQGQSLHSSDSLQITPVCPAFLLNLFLTVFLCNLTCYPTRPAKTRCQLLGHSMQADVVSATGASGVSAAAVDVRSLPLTSGVGEKRSVPKGTATGDDQHE